MESPLFTAPASRYRVGMTARRPATAAFAVLALLALTGCMSGAPAPGPTPSGDTPSGLSTPTPDPSSTRSPSPTPTVAAPVAATVVVTATSITVLDAASTVIVDVPYTIDGDEAAAKLAQALGVTPVEKVRPDDSGCFFAGSVYQFGGLSIDATASFVAPPAVFSAYVSASSTSGGVTLLGPAGVQAGMTAAEVIARIPSAAPSSGALVDAPVALETLSRAGTYGAIGVRGAVVAGTLEYLEAPVYLEGEC